MKKFLTLFMMAICVFSIFILSTQSSTLDALHFALDDPMLSYMYDFLDRMLLKYPVYPFCQDIRPYTYGQVRHLLLFFLEQKLSILEKEQTKLYLNFLIDPKSFTSYETEESIFKLGLHTGLHFTSRTETNEKIKREFAWQIRPIVTGKINKNITFSTDLRFFLIGGDNLPNTIRTEVEVDQRNEKSFDTGALVLSYLQFEFPWFDLLIGKQNISWGPGRSDNLLLSAYGMPMEMIYFRGIYEKVSFQFFHGIGQDRTGNKIISGHRIELLPSPRYRLGLSEVVVINSRYFDPRFLNPITVYTVSEISGEGYFQYQGGDNYSKGNLLISGDISIKLTSQIDVYIELLVDDFQPRYRWESYLHWGSKWGVLLGSRVSEPFSIPNIYILLEYIFVNQYSYTHVEPLNSYFHLEKPIGFQMGPDSQSVYAKASYQLTPNLSTSLTLEIKDKGEQKITEPRKETDKEDEHWEYLSGVEEKKAVIGLLIRFFSIGSWNFETRYNWKNIRNYGHQKNKNYVIKEFQAIGLYRF